MSSAKRQIAGRLGVDPYTDFKPLAGKLDEIARVTALGNLTVGAAFTAIPGGAGMVISSSRTAQSLGQLVTDKTSTELRAINRSRLAAMGVANNVADAFLNNQVYTPLDQTSIVSSLMQMRGVKNRQLFIQRATNAIDRDLVFFLRRRAELTAEYHNGVESFTEFIDTSGVPLNVTRSGRIVAIFPLDGLAWTQTTNNAVAAIDRELKRRKLEDVEIRITGSATASVRRGMQELGWKLVENIER